MAGPVVVERLRPRQVEPVELDEDQIAPEGPGPGPGPDGGRCEPKETDRAWLAGRRRVTDAGFEREQCQAEETFLHHWYPLHEALLDVLDRSWSTPAGREVPDL